MQKYYRWGILGLGNIAHQFAKGLSVTDKGKLFAVGSRSIDKANNFARQYNAEIAYGSYQELINDINVDIIYIATPHNSHYELSIQCLNAGKAVLCEKPAAINSQQFAKVQKLAIEKNLFFMDAFWARFHPHIKKVMELVEQNTIGEVMLIQADFGFKVEFDPNHRLFNPVLGGGTILDIGIYPAFLALLLLGYPNEVKASAVKGKTKIDESCGMIFTYKNKKMAVLSSTFLADTEIKASVFGTKGKILLDEKWFSPSKIFVHINDTEIKEYYYPAKMNGYEYEAEEVMDCLDKNLTESPLLPLNFTKQLIKLTDEIRKSAGINYIYDEV